MGEKDIAERSLIWFKDVFADIFNVLVLKGEERIDPNDLREGAGWNWYRDDEKLRDMQRDVAMYWERSFVSADGEGCERKIIALLGIENQTRYDSKMPLRVIGYDGADYRSQYDNKNIYPVVTLVLSYRSTGWGANCKLADTVSPYIPKVLKKKLSDTPILVVSLCELSDETIAQFTSDFRHVANYVKHLKDKDYRMTDTTEICHPKELFNFLGAISGDPRYAQFDFEGGGGPKSMCEFYDRVLAEGCEKARREMREEVRDEVREEERRLALAFVLKNLAKSIGRGPEDVLNLMDISDTDRQMCLSALQG